MAKFFSRIPCLLLLLVLLPVSSARAGLAIWDATSALEIERRTKELDGTTPVSGPAGREDWRPVEDDAEILPEETEKLFTALLERMKTEKKLHLFLVTARSGELASYKPAALRLVGTEEAGAVILLTESGLRYGVALNSAAEAMVSGFRLRTTLNRVFRDRAQIGDPERGAIYVLNQLTELLAGPDFSRKELEGKMEQIRPEAPGLLAVGNDAGGKEEPGFLVRWLELPAVRAGLATTGLLLLAGLIYWLVQRRRLAQEEAALLAAAQPETGAPHTRMEPRRNSLPRRTDLPAPGPSNDRLVAVPPPTVASTALSLNSAPSGASQELTLPPPPTASRAAAGSAGGNGALTSLIHLMEQNLALMRQTPPELHPTLIDSLETVLGEMKLQTQAALASGGGELAAASAPVVASRTALKPPVGRKTVENGGGAISPRRTGEAAAGQGEEE